MGDVFDLVASLELSVSKVSRTEMAEMVAARVARSGELNDTDIAYLIEHSGWSRASLFRVAGGCRPAAPEFGPEVTFLDRIAVGGASAFVFDDLAIGMLAAHGGNMRRFRQDVLRYAAEHGLDLEMPSESQLSRRFRSEVRQYVRNGVRHGHKNRYSDTLRMRWEPDYVNQICQLDEFILDLACLAPAKDHESDFVDDNGDPLEPVKVYVGDRKRWMVPVRARLLPLLEAKSRFVKAWAATSRPPNQHDTLALLGDSVDVRRADNGADALIGGRFDVLTSDNAGCFRNLVVKTAIEAQGGDLDIAVGYDPVAKAKEERLGATLQAKIVTGLVGHLSHMETRDGRDMLGVPAHLLLPFGQVVEIIGRAVYEYNYIDVHSTLGTTPFEAFVAGCPNPEPVPDELLGSMMLEGPRKGGERDVLSDGLQAFGRRGYLAPELARPGVFGEKVKIRVFHHRKDKIAVFKPIKRRTDPDAAEFVGLAHDCSTVPKAKREHILSIWQVDAATINDAADTAQRLREISKGVTGGLPTTIAEAAVTDAERAARALEDLDTPGEEDDDAAEHSGQVVDPPRRPKTTRRKPKPEQDPPAAPAARESDELDLLEAALGENPPADADEEN